MSEVDIEDALSALGPRASKVPDLGRTRTAADQYGFVWRDTNKIGALSDEELLRRLAAATGAMARERPEFPNLDKCRTVYNTIAMEMNGRGRVAPSFRPRMRPPKTMERTSADDTHSKDLQVLDLHWWYLHINKGDEVSATATLQPLFHFGEFPDFPVMAGENFADLPWPMNRKIAAMRLSPADSWLMAALRDPTIAKRRRKIEQRAARIKGEIEHRLVFDGRLAGAPEDWRDLFIAQQIAGYVALETGVQPSPRHVARFYNLMTGKQVLRQTVNNKLKRMRERLRPK